MTRSTTWRRRTPLRTRTRSRKRSDRRWNLREVNFPLFSFSMTMIKQNKTLHGLLKNTKNKITEKTLSDCDVSGVLQCCKVARYVANHVSFHSPITMTEQKKTLGLLKNKKNHRKNTSNVVHLPGMSPTMSLVIHQLQ